jgi:hypothetical protein
MVPIPDVSTDGWLGYTQYILGYSHCLIHTTNHELNTLFRGHPQFGQIQGGEECHTAVKQPLNPARQDKLKSEKHPLHENMSMLRSQEDKEVVNSCQ